MRRGSMNVVNVAHDLLISETCLDEGLCPGLASMSVEIASRKGQ